MKTVKNALLMLGISAIAAFSAPALAADAPAGSLTFGIIDMNRVMQKTDAAKDVFGQLDAKRKEYVTQLSKEEDSLRALQQDLEKQKDKLSKAAFDEKSKAFTEKLQKWQKQADDRKKTWAWASDDAMKKVRMEAVKVVNQVAKDKHYSAVFLSDAVMVSTPDLDMTDAVIEQMNKNVKKIPVDWNAAAAAAAADDEAAGKNGKMK